MTLPTKHKALVLKAQNDLSIETFDVYHPEAGELLVRVEAVALNPADWKLRDRGFQRYPTVLGLDAAGVVVAVGDGVTSTAVGDKMCASTFLYLPAESHVNQLMFCLDSTLGTSAISALAHSSSITKRDQNLPLRSVPVYSLLGSPG